MAEKSRKGNSFTFTAKAWESNGRLRVTAVDPAFRQTAGIHLPVKLDTQSEESLRTVGADLGVVWPSQQTAAQDRAARIREQIAGMTDEQLEQIAAQVPALDVEGAE